MQKHVSCMLLFVLGSSARNTWVETNQSDFSDGIYEKNIYASHLGDGAVEFVPRFDLNLDGYIDLFTADNYGPYASIYWGSSAGYSPISQTLFPTVGAGNCDAADLNGDSYPDFLITHPNATKISLYWGSSIGPNPSNHFDIPLQNSDGEACFIADFDKDGYLDIAIDRSVPMYGAILWGSALGYDFNNRTDLPVRYGQHNIEVADFNHDTWLDVIFLAVDEASNQNRIYWGSSNGFFASSCTSLPALDGEHGVSVADLNKDDYLDLVFTHWYEEESYIYWGSPAGYSSLDVGILHPGYCYGGSAVADINTDGHLDIVFHRGGYGVYPQEIYWGSAVGFSDNDTSCFGIPLEVTGGFIADLNFDGSLDVFSNTITPGTDSYIFVGPLFSNNTALPVSDDHHAMFREIGNVYNRDYYEDYLSSIFDAQAIVNWRIISWDDSLPPSTGVLFYVRSGNTATPDPSWSDWDSLGQGDEIDSTLNSRYLQYRARLTYTNPAYLPYLYEVMIEYNSLAQIIVEPDQTGSTYPGVEKRYYLSVINLGADFDTIDLTYDHNQTWPVVLYDSSGSNVLIDHNNNSLVDIITSSGDTVEIVLSITPPGNAAAGSIDSLVIFGISSIDPFMSDSAIIITTIPYGQVIIYPDCADSGYYGDSIDYHLIVQNLQYASDIIDLAVIDADFIYSLRDMSGNLLFDTDGNGLVDLGSCAPFASESLIVRVNIPSAQTVPIDTAMIRALSSTNPFIYDEARLITRIIGTIWGLILEPDQEGQLEPGATMSFPVDVLLQGDVADIIELTLDDYPSDWSIRLTDSANVELTDTDADGFVDLGVVEPEQTRRFLATVSAPQNYSLIGEIDSLIFCDFYVHGWCSSDAQINDSVYLKVEYVPAFEIHNFPNPFQTLTQFVFGLPKEGRVSLFVYNRSGELLRRLIDDQLYPLGVHTYSWNGTNNVGKGLAPGVYIYVLDFKATDGEHETTKKKAVKSK